MTAADLPEAALATFAATTVHDAIAEPVRHQARRSLLNILATTLAGCREPAVDIAHATLAPLSPGGPCTLIGRGATTDPATAACLNAMAANIFDFDDTHEATIIHPAAIPFAACLAEAQTRPVSGADFLAAFAIGCEVECRIGNAVSPGHYARGWHITSTCGAFGAAAATGALLGLTPDQMRHAFANAAVQTGGLVEALGAMAKSLGVGAAARAGLLSARMASAGMTGPEAPLTGTRGWLCVHADDPRPEALTTGLGTDWELAHNTFKPYPVGVVLNPVLDATLALRAGGLRLEDVEGIELTGHPLLRQRTDRPDVATGRESQVSAQHAIAIALITGKAGLDEFTDEAVARTSSLRPAITFHDDPARDIASVAMIVHRRDGPPLSREITAARGSQGNPMSDAEIADKLTTLAARLDRGHDAAAIARAIRTLDNEEDAGSLIGRLAG